MSEDLNQGKYFRVPRVRSVRLSFFRTVLKSNYILDTGKMLIAKYTIQSPQKFTNPILLVCIQILPSVPLIFQSIHYVKKKYTLKHHSVPVLMADYLTIYYHILLYKTEV